MDLGDGFFVARFQIKEDLDYVLTNNPWVIMKQYLVVQRWRPNFMPGEDYIQSMHVWGHMCKVDHVTLNQARGRFAQICVETDITKSLIANLNIDGRLIRVDYESLSSICVICGRYGHNKEICKEGMVEPIPEELIAACSNKMDSDKEVPIYGPWLLVSYGKQGNRVNKGRVDRNDRGNPNTLEGNGSLGKNLDSGRSNDRKSDGIGKGLGMGSSERLKSGTNRTKDDLGSSFITVKVTCSRFDILSDEGDVMMADGSLQVIDKVEEGWQFTDKVVLGEVTNQKNL
ncbi:hypothetical protein Ddye_022751 [Dipteronia dyeriana]|uniref:DUF4283 domain-containing protein n=1 Tax=Dipteronia dyeriana TaxID=168575 RepID=A0AAD9TSL0_9ROSI|nr:hypothetical protein Ddye_022751 [Dipteronia dyeriana]